MIFGGGMTIVKGVFEFLILPVFIDPVLDSLRIISLGEHLSHVLFSLVVFMVKDVKYVKRRILRIMNKIYRVALFCQFPH